MADRRKYTKEQIIEILRAKSVDGIAPPSIQEGSLYQLVYRNIGSWEKACKMAGVEARVSSTD